MKLSDLRRAGSQALDNWAEFILTDASLRIYESTGNGVYYLARVYKVIKTSPLKESFVEMQISDVERLVGGLA